MTMCTTHMYYGEVDGDDQNYYEVCNFGINTLEVQCMSNFKLTTGKHFQFEPNRGNSYLSLGFHCPQASSWGNHTLVKSKARNMVESPLEHYF